MDITSSFSSAYGFLISAIGNVLNIMNSITIFGVSITMIWLGLTALSIIVGIVLTSVYTGAGVTASHNAREEAKEKKKK